jgi:hypothetical protein
MNKKHTKIDELSQYSSFAQTTATFSVIILLALIPLLEGKNQIPPVMVFCYEFSIGQFLWGASLLFSFAFIRNVDKILDKENELKGNDDSTFDQRLKSIWFLATLSGWILFTIALLLVGNLLDVQSEIIKIATILSVILFVIVTTNTVFGFK